MTGVGRDSFVVQGMSDHNSDVLSFCKEEEAGETMNVVSIMARCNHMDKIDALQMLADEAIAEAKLASTFLSEHQVAHAAMRSWLRGYVNFHFSSGRYNLDQVLLD